MKIYATYLVTILKSFLFLVLIVGLGACNNYQKEVSVINGVVEDCEDCLIEFGYDDPGQLKDVKLKQAKVRQGKFAFVLDADSLPRAGVYRIKLVLNETHRLRTDKFKDFEFPIYLPADSVHLVLDPAGSPGKKAYPYPKASSHLKFADIKSTSLIQKELEYYLRQRDSMDVKFDNYLNLRKAFFSQAIGNYDKKEMDKWADTLNNFFATGGLYRPKAADVFIRKYPASMLVPYAMLDNHKQMSAASRFRKYFRAMSPEQQNSYYGKVLDKRLAGWEKRNTAYAKYIVGAEISYLAGKNPEGKKLDAGKIFKKSKLTLVDFWASWCDSCRYQTPDYRRLYQTYKGKGFEIIGVSLDVNVGDWQRAIQEDNMNWYQLSDLKENHGDIQRFRLKSIPANIVMNQKGRIVAANVSPKELEALLMEKL